MTLTIELTAEQERRLTQAAATKGLSPDKLAFELLSESLTQESFHTTASQEWNDRFAALITEMRQLNAPAMPEETFRRENLYDDRGM